MDEKRISVLLDKFYQYIDHNLSCTLYEAPVTGKTSSSAIQVLDQLYNQPDLCAEFWCDGTKAYFIKYRGDKQAYDRFCQLAEIATEFLALPKKEERSSNTKYWVYHLIDSLRSDANNSIKKHVYGDLKEEIRDLIFTQNREMMILYKWAKDSTQKSVLISSSDIKNLFNASAHVLEKMYKSLEGQLPKLASGKTVQENLTDTEQNIIEALGDKTMKGQELLKNAGYDYSSHYKTILSNLVKRGILENIHNKGYKRK
jgi:hypothetical protein